MIKLYYILLDSRVRGNDKIVCKDKIVSKDKMLRKVNYLYQIMSDNDGGKLAEEQAFK